MKQVEKQDGKMFSWQNGKHKFNTFFMYCQYIHSLILLIVVDKTLWLSSYTVHWKTIWKLNSKGTLAQLQTILNVVGTNK